MEVEKLFRRLFLIKTIKVLRNLFRKQFADIITSFSKGNIDEEKIAIYVDNFPNWFEVLENYNQKQLEAERVAEYQAVVNEKMLLAEKLKQQAQEEQTLVQEELAMTEKGYALDAKQGLAKFNKERKLKKRLEQTQQTINSLEKLIIEQTPQKRPVGRPRKNGTSPK